MVERISLLSMQLWAEILAYKDRTLTSGHPDPHRSQDLPVAEVELTTYLPLSLDHVCYKTYKVTTYKDGTMDGRQFRFYLQGNGLIYTRL